MLKQLVDGLRIQPHEDGLAAIFRIHFLKHLEHILNRAVVEKNLSFAPISQCCLRVTGSGGLLNANLERMHIGKP